MDDVSSEIARIKPLLEKAKDILIVTHANPTFDSFGSALSLFLGLKSIGKQVIVGCPTPMTVEYSDFVGANKIQTSFAKKNFVISLDYEDGSIEKVSYNIEGKKFNLIIEPRQGYEGFSEDHVHFGNEGIHADVIITVDTIHLGGLGALYEGEKELFATIPIINIDSHSNNAMYGEVNAVGVAGSTAELVAEVLSELGVTLTEDIATNLLNSIYHETNTFQNFVTARTFEVAASCLRAGGKRFSHKEKHPDQPELPKEEKKEENIPQHVSPPPPVTASASSSPVSPPEDWLKPKIFKSSTIS